MWVSLPRLGEDWARALHPAPRVLHALLWTALKKLASKLFSLKDSYEARIIVYEKKTFNLCCCHYYYYDPAYWAQGLNSPELPQSPNSLSYKQNWQKSFSLGMPSCYLLRCPPLAHSVLWNYICLLVISPPQSDVLWDFADSYHISLFPSTFPQPKLTASVFWRSLQGCGNKS